MIRVPFDFPPLIFLMQALIQDITGVKVVSLHHDISTVTGEAFFIFTLAEPPCCLETKKK